ncbi:MAG: hypothetical protein JST19_15675 [Bacteroidetes bacterium]|nr:hypothetical protein [Bacteroidota bacterium]
MPFYRPDEINTNAVCVLKKRPDGNLYVDYESLINPIPGEIVRLETSIRHASQKRANELYHEIKADPVLKTILQRPSTFCNDLWSAWQEDNSEKRLDQIFESQFYDKVQELTLMVLAFKLHHTYAKCRADENILAYSHRMIGWVHFTHQLNDNFKATFQTNFGFGSATHFCVRLNFRGIDIVPLTHWVHYQIVKQKEVIYCSQNYWPQHENWYKAMDYVKTACNLYHQNEEQFIKRYILHECQELVKKLENVVSNHRFEFIISGYHFVVKHEWTELKGEELIAFRAHKVSGSLAFIDYINSYAHFANINAVIQSIEQLNRDIIPVIEAAVERITPELEAKERRMTGLKMLHHELHDENKAYYDERQRIQQEMHKQGKYHPDFTDEEFNLKYPDYKKFKAKYELNTKIYSDLNTEIYHLKYYLEQYGENLADIQAYFAGSTARNIA